MLLDAGSGTLTLTAKDQKECMKRQKQKSARTVDRKLQFIWTNAALLSLVGRPEVLTPRHTRFVLHTVDTVGHERCRKFTQRFGNPSEVLTASSAHC